LGAWFIYKSFATWWVVVVVVAVFIIATLIQMKKDNDLQEWLYRCWFGRAPKSEKYLDLETEMTALQVVGKAR
jgi:hypothetical protein